MTKILTDWSLVSVCTLSVLCIVFFAVVFGLRAAFVRHEFLHWNTHLYYIESWGTLFILTEKKCKEKKNTILDADCSRGTAAAASHQHGAGLGDWCHFEGCVNSRWQARGKSYKKDPNGGLRHHLIFGRLFE